MKLSPEQVRHVAKLARLTLSEEEGGLYRHQLSAILEAVDKLSSLDTQNVEPTSHATLAESVLRKDEVANSIDLAEALANAPQKIGTSFAVPKILD